MRRTVLTLILMAPAVAAAQVPAVPAVPVVPATPVAAAPAKNLYSFLCPTPEQKALCKAHFCSSPAGQLVNNLLKPVAGVSGGLIGPVCPGPLTPDAEALAKPADSVQGAAARIKAEEAQAAAKVADLEYLATKNCKRYPEAEAALINGLRAEANECVRLAAARGLARGCCCTAKVLKALTLTVNGSTADGFPAEESPRVRLMAFLALERCANACQALADETAPELPAAPPADVLPASYYTEQFPKLKSRDVLLDARRTLAAGLNLPPGSLPRGRSLQDVLTIPTQAARPTPTPAPRPQLPPQPVARSREPRSLSSIVRAAWER